MSEENNATGWQVFYTEARTSFVTTDKTIADNCLKDGATVIETALAQSPNAVMGETKMGDIPLVDTAGLAGWVTHSGVY
ncbi:hypothetical protein [Azomonas macrocytogenes]|uniref:Uncharacterized protein n=1 Tax=Azomonas macrocytogenes TaxID=69962 RepID=A0A839T8I6_AZOMA|nr:hypothetical protein [Azomonas macrocytogenes]MBB3104766.1 hypothetical protein [Azomonas macrocytogenes]